MRSITASAQGWLLSRSSPIIFFALTALPLGLLAFLTLSLTSDALTRQGKENAQGVSATNAAYLDDHFVQTNEVLLTFSGDRLVKDLGSAGAQPNVGALRDHLAQLVTTQDGPQEAFVTNGSGTVITDPNGQQASWPTRLDQVRLGGEPWYHGMATAPSFNPSTIFIFGNGSVGGITNSHQVAIATPLLLSGGTDQVGGYLVGVYSIQWVEDRVEAFAQDRGVSLTIVDQQGTVLITPVSLPGTLTTNKADATMLAGFRGRSSGVTSRTGPRGQVLTAYSPLKHTAGWTLVADVSAQPTITTVNTLRTAILAIDGGLSLFLLAEMFVVLGLLNRAKESAELKERNESLRGLDEAARTVHSLRGEPALDELAATAARLVDADFSGLTVLSEGSLDHVESVHAVPGSTPQEAITDLVALLDQTNGQTAAVRVDDLLWTHPSVSDLLPPLGPLVAVPLVAGDEVLGRLMVGRPPGAQAFNEVNEGLLRQIAQHAVTAVHKRRQDQEREAFLQELQGKNDELELASRFKSEFLANMSHELRTPLSAIIGFSDLLMDGADGDLNEDQTEDIGQIQRAGRSLLGLINDILDLSKIEAGRMTLEMEENDLAEIVKDVIATIKPLAEAKSIYLVADMPEEMEKLFCDQIRIRQVITNLVSNAIKFTSDGGVTIRCEELGEEMEVSVVDTGIGMAPEALDKIFDQFVQAESGTTRKFGGTGLGLAISRKLVELHGGQIGVESEEGKGSRFWFRIHKKRQVAEPVAPNVELAPAVAPDGPGLPWRSLTQDRILVVDDEAPARQMIVRRLSEIGYEAAEAANAEEALRLAREIHPAAITLDVMMPGVNGWKVLNALKSDPLTADIPVVVVSIVDGKEVAMTLGAASYMTKPFSKDELLRHLTRVIPDIEGADILCVDDEAPMREVVTKSLDQAGMQVRGVASGKDALEEVEKKVPDAVLVDLMMPEMSGFELVVRLRTRPELDRVPIIVLSARELTEEDVAALASKVDRFIPKAELRGSDLGATLRQAIEHRRVTTAATGMTSD